MPLFLTEEQFKSLLLNKLFIILAGNPGFQAPLNVNGLFLMRRPSLA